MIKLKNDYFIESDELQSYAKELIIGGELGKDTK